MNNLCLNIKGAIPIPNAILSPSIQIIPIRLLVNHIKQRLRAEPASLWCSHSLVRIKRILLVDLDCIAPSSGCGCIRHQLGVATLLQADEPEYCLFDGLAACKETVVHEKSSFLVADGFCDLLAFDLGEDDAVKLFVDDVVLLYISLKRIIKGGMLTL